MEKKFKGGLYKIVVDGVGTYYGESVNIPARWARHRKQLYNRRHANLKLKAAWHSPEIGPSKFHFIVIEQSEELTKNTDLRLYREKLLILEDPNNLNVVHGSKQAVTEAQLPPRPLYQNRTVVLKRHSRTNFVKVCNEKGQLLGTEYLDFKFRLGKFTTDSECRLTRVGPRTGIKNKKPKCDHSRSPAGSMLCVYCGERLYL